MGGFGSPDSEARLFRYTVGKWSKEFGWAIFFWIIAWRLTKYMSRHLYVFTRHPVAVAVTIITVIIVVINPLILLIVGIGLYLAALEAWLHNPPWYSRHIGPRGRGFLYGLRFKWRLRSKLKACGLIDNDDRTTPLPIRTRVHGCTTTVLMKMVAGQELEWYRVRSARLAQTFKALDCKANPYRVGKTTKPQYVQLELLARDPFTSNLGPEYIDYHSQPDTFTPAVATQRSGQPQNDNLAAHKLAIAMTRWGKSSRIRARIYANRNKIRKRELELWGIDGKGGIEHSFLEHAFAYVAYGDSTTNQHAYNPAEFDRLLKAAVRVMKKRQRGMRGEVTEHTPTDKEPWLLIIIDELLVLTNKALPPELRTSIAASINLILQQGIACGVSIDASTQLATKDNLDPINRGGFTEFEIGKVERGVVDMIFGTGWWERGAKADEIPEDLKGVFYKKTESTMVPEQIRYPYIPVEAVSPKALGFTIDRSVLWRPPLEAVPDPEPQPEVIGQIDDKPIQLIAGASTDPPVRSKSIPPNFGGFA